MSSMNNWLAFSLSPQHHHQQDDQHHSRLQGFNSDDMSSATDECFDLSSSTAPPPPSQHPFDALDDASASFNNRNNSNSTNLQTQDWNNSENGCFKTTSEMSAFIGSSCNNNNNGCHSLQDQQQQQQQPKLENFLGRHSLSNSHYHHSTAAGDYMFSTESMAEAAANNNQVFSNNNSSIGLSMIKTWLRSNQGGASGSGHVQQSLQQQQIPNNNEMFSNGDDESGRAAVLCGGGGDNDDINKAHTGGAQTLSLSMSTGSQSNSSAPLPLLDAGEGVDKTALGGLTEAVVEAVPRKSLDTFGQRTSIYRGVTRHRWTGRYEAHLWDNSCRREGQTRKGRQVYLGGYDKEEKAARAYDLAALKYWGTTTTTNFPISSYEKEIEEMKHMTRQEYVASLRRKSSGFSRGASIYRGVTRHHQHGRWQARIGRVAGNKDLYLGTFSTQEEAAEAYDIAAIKFRGLNAVTNFEMSRYDVNSILESSTLPIGGAAKRLKDAEQAMEMTSTMELGLISQRAAAAAALNHEALGSHLTDGTMMSYSSNAQWPTIAFHHPPYNTASMHQQYSPYARVWCKQEQDSTSDQGTTTNQSYHQDLHQLQLGNGATHNFFQQPNTSVLHNLMSLGSSSMEHSSGSNSVIYGNGEGHGYNGYGASVNNNSGFAMPVGSTLIGNEDNSNVAYGTANAYNQARNLYYLQQQQQQLYKGGGYDPDSGCTSWVPTAIPNLGQRSGTGPNNNLAAAGNQPFTVWNETWK